MRTLIITLFMLLSSVSWAQYSTEDINQEVIAAIAEENNYLLYPLTDYEKEYRDLNQIIRNEQTIKEDKYFLYLQYKKRFSYNRGIMLSSKRAGDLSIKTLRRSFVLTQKSLENVSLKQEDYLFIPKTSNKLEDIKGLVKMKKEFHSQLKTLRERINLIKDYQATHAAGKVPEINKRIETLQANIQIAKADGTPYEVEEENLNQLKAKRIELGDKKLLRQLQMKDWLMRKMLKT